MYTAGSPLFIAKAFNSTVGVILTAKKINYYIHIFFYCIRNQMKNSTRYLHQAAIHQSSYRLLFANNFFKFFHFLEASIRTLKDLVISDNWDCAYPMMNDYASVNNYFPYIQTSGGTGN